jgi:predicted metal-dependent enzyme (double-stranded beta helix superfamily)
MLDLDDFIADCQAALEEQQPLLAVKEVLERAVADPDGVAAALPPTHSGIVPIHVAPDLTILKVVWAPGLSFGPHDHRMWAAIGIYGGGEDNEFFRRDGCSLTASGGRELRTGDVCLLGDDVIHAVTNPTAQFTGAIHVYGGDLLGTPRSEWRGEPFAEEPYDVARTLAYFEEANAALDTA